MKSAFELLAAGGALESIAKECERLNTVFGKPDLPASFWVNLLKSEVSQLATCFGVRVPGSYTESRILAERLEIREVAVSAAAKLLAVIECLDRLEKKGMTDAKEMPN